MSLRLLLDEMFSPRIALELTARGYNCCAVVSDPDLQTGSDQEILEHALGQVLVTNNVSDFERLRRSRARTDQPTPSLIYTSDLTFPRNRKFLGRIIEALDQVASIEATDALGSVLWLQPPKPDQ
ncbi:MAG: DUF5615 family PIN-like protein [Candidatus Dormibacteraceae bacterium]